MSRVIVVSETVYSELQKIKKNESFSKAIEELIKDKMQKGDISQLESFFGTLDKKGGSSWKMKETGSKYTRRIRSEWEKRSERDFHG